MTAVFLAASLCALTRDDAVDWKRVFAFEP